MTDRTDGANHSVMRELNRSLILRHLMEGNPVSRADLARQTSLAKPTVSGIVENLVREGIVREVGMGPATAVGGRRPMLLELNPESQHFAGIQIGVQRTNIVIADALGNEVLRRQVDTPRGPGEKALVLLIEATRDLIASRPVVRSSLAAVGVCVPGLVDAQEGICLLAPNLGWHEVPVRDLMEARLSVAAVVANTPDVSLVTEHYDGCARGVGDVALLYVGRGIGGAVISNGELFQGHRGLATEIGHCTVPGVSRRCRCGNVGCLETVADGPAIARLAIEGLKKGKASSLSEIRPHRRISARDVGDAANSGDEFAQALLADVGQRLGIAASWMVNLFNPEMLVVAGGVANAGEPLIDPIRHEVVKHSLAHSYQDLRIVPWTKGRDAGVSGAVLMARRATDSSYHLLRAHRRVRG